MQCVIPLSIDLSWQSLQINFEFVLQIIGQKTKNFQCITMLCLCKRGRERHLCWSACFLVLIMPISSVKGEVYCFPLRKLIFRFDRWVISFERSLRLRVHSEINSVRLSVRTTIFKRIPWLHFHPTSLMSSSMDLSQRALLTKWKLLLNFEFVF